MLSSTQQAILGHHLSVCDKRVYQEERIIKRGPEGSHRRFCVFPIPPLPQSDPPAAFRLESKDRENRRDERCPTTHGTSRKCRRQWRECTDQDADYSTGRPQCRSDAVARST